MNRPYIICHMVQSIDGKVTGDFLYSPECEKATDIYYEINREYCHNGFICGRVTMEGSFTGGNRPDLNDFPCIESDEDFTDVELSQFYAVSFDPMGKVGWSDAFIDDEDPGYDMAQVIEVVSGKVDRRYLGYLRSVGIPYIFAGEEEIDVPLALSKLRALGMDTLLLEGGSVINGYFQRADCIDELSLVVAPVVSQGDGKPLFENADISGFNLKEIKEYDDSVLWLNYTKA